MRLTLLALLIFGTYCTAGTCVCAQDQQPSVLTDQQWEDVDASVERGLHWIAQQQERNGAFPTLPQGQPAVTSLCVLAFAAHGHLPGEGPYGETLSSAVDFITSCQKPSGLNALVGPAGTKVSRNVSHEVGSTAAYNHAIASLTMSELYGIVGQTESTKLRPLVEKSLTASLAMQDWPSDRKIDEGGWRYLHKFQGINADLSITGWELMFLRSAKNAGFDVPPESVDNAVEYVKRCFDSEYKTFVYKLEAADARSRAMSGAGVLALAHAGMHNTDEARQASDWILRHNFSNYNQRKRFTSSPQKDRYHYSLFNCTQAMYQMGDNYWQQFFPHVAKVVLDNQNANGSWQADSHEHETRFGQAYTTSLVLLTLAAPNQLLPIFQR